MSGRVVHILPRNSSRSWRNRGTAGRICIAKDGIIVPMIKRGFPAEDLGRRRSRIRWVWRIWYDCLHVQPVNQGLFRGSFLAEGLFMIDKEVVLPNGSVGPDYLIGVGFVKQFIGRGNRAGFIVVGGEKFFPQQIAGMAVVGIFAGGHVFVNA